MQTGEVAEHVRDFSTQLVLVKVQNFQVGNVTQPYAGMLPA